MRLSREETVNLVLKAQSGDESSFEALVHSFYDSLRYYTGRFSSDYDVQDEILQTIWVTVFYSLKHLRHREAFITWLFRIAHNQVMSQLRIQRTIDSRFPVSLDDPSTIIGEEPDDDYLPSEAHFIHEGLLRLSPEHREVLVLRFMEDLDYTSIAKVTNVSLGTVRFRIHYAKVA